jgi:hypothetical protein
MCRAFGPYGGVSAGGPHLGWPIFAMFFVAKVHSGAQLFQKLADRAVRMEMTEDHRRILRGQPCDIHRLLVNCLAETIYDRTGGPIMGVPFMTRVLSLPKDAA